VVSRGGEELERIGTDQLGDVLQRLQCEVAFPAFDRGDVGAVHHGLFCEAFLRPAAFGAVGAQVPADASLEFAFHDREA
jgi:hypothetical protein